MHTGFTRTILAAAAVAMSAQVAGAFPDRAVTIIVPFGPGGSADTVTRALASALEPELGEAVAILNRGGAAGTVGAAQAAQSAPDGHTLAVLPITPLALQPNLRELPYTPADFDYICQLYEDPLVFAVGVDSEVDSLEALIAAAEAAPGALRYGSSGPGSIQHLAMVDLGRRYGVEMTHVPHGGDTENIQSILAGVLVGWPVLYGVAEANSGTVRSIAVMAEERLAAAPDLPTFAELGFESAFSIWGGLVAPAGLPAEVKESLSAVCEAAVASDTFINTMAQLNIEIRYRNAAEFEAFAMDEFERLGALLREVGLAN